MPDGTLASAAATPTDRPGARDRAPDGLLRAARRTTPRSASARPTWPATGRPATGTDLAELLTPFAERLTTLVPRAAAAAARRRRPTASRSTSATRSLGSREQHRGALRPVSNDLFAAFLDATMSYSSALFDEDEPLRRRRPRGGAAAQGRRRSSTWPASARAPGCSRSAPAGARSRSRPPGAARTVTTRHPLGRAGAPWRSERVAEAGLADRVDVRLQDYREVEGSYDAIVSVEMIEAVGEEYWPTYFRTIDELLAPGGRVAIQAIPMAHDRLLATRQLLRLDPEVHLPRRADPVAAGDRRDDSPPHTDAAGERPARRFGPHYAETLRRWRETLPRAAGREVAALGFDETFRRMWEFYLAYCEAGFAHRLPRRRPAAADQREPVMSDLAGKAVWLVGASSGIGAALAARAGRSWRAGCDLGPAGRPSSRPSPAAGCRSSPLDVTDRAAVRRAAGGSAAELGGARRRGLVARATGSRSTPPPGTPRSFARHVEVNLLGLNNVLAAVAAADARARRGRLVGIASVAGYRGHRRRGGLRRHQGRADQPAGGAAGRGRRPRGAGDHRLPRVRPHRDDRGATSSRCRSSSRPTQAARAICDGLERDRAEIVFPSRWRC